MNQISYIFVDGYNVINAWGFLKELQKKRLEDARDKLIDYLQEFVAIRHVKVVVVFDAHYVKGSTEKKDRNGRVQVVYTKEGESADCYIERMVVKFSKKEVVAVVTSDYLEQRITLQMGGIRITPNEFLLEVKNVKKKIKETITMSFVEGRNTLENYVNKDILEKLEKIRRSP